MHRSVFFRLLFVAALAVSHAGVVAAADPSASREKSTIVSPSPVYEPNYLHGALMRTPHRWRRFPLRVYFAPDGAYSEERERQVLAGFGEWTHATGGILSYVVIGSAGNADVIVRLLPDAHIGGDAATVGLTHSLARGPWMEQAHMDLATGAPMTPNLLTEVAAHEWGHALGIDGHSDDPGDLMYGVTVRMLSAVTSDVEPPDRPRTPTTRDLNTIRTIYADRFTAAR